MAVKYQGGRAVPMTQSPSPVVKQAMNDLEARMFAVLKAFAESQQASWRLAKAMGESTIEWTARQTAIQRQMEDLYQNFKNVNSGRYS